MKFGLATNFFMGGVVVLKKDLQTLKLELLVVALLTIIVLLIIFK